MKIEVTDIGRTFGRQTRAYAEYRVFSSLARFADAVREVVVSVTPTARGHTVTSSVIVRLETGQSVSVAARGRHPYDAIDRVAQQLRPALVRHTHVELPS